MNMVTESYKNNNLDPKYTEELDRFRGQFLTMTQEERIDWSTKGFNLIFLKDNKLNDGENGSGNGRIHRMMKYESQLKSELSKLWEESKKALYNRRMYNHL
jgi:hypothetical protein